MVIYYGINTLFFMTLLKEIYVTYSSSHWNFGMYVQKVLKELNICIKVQKMKNVLFEFIY